MEEQKQTETLFNAVQELNKIDAHIKSHIETVDKTLLSDDNKPTVAQLEYCSRLVHKLKTAMICTEYQEMVHMAAAKIKDRSNSLRVDSLKQLDSFVRFAIQLLNDLDYDSIDSYDNEFQYSKQIVLSFEHKFETVVSDLESQFNSALNEYRSRFDKIEEKMDAEFDDKLSSYTELCNSTRAELEKVKEIILKDHSEKFKETKTKIAAHEAHINEKKAQIDNLVLKTADKAIVGDFNKAARQEERQGAIWRAFALFFLFLMAGYTFTSSGGIFSGGSVKDVLEGVAHLVTFLIAFVYCARVSSSHYEEAREYRHKELELAAISPYLSDLTEENYQELKKQLAQVYFCNSKSEKPLQDESICLGFGSIKEVMTYIRDFAKDLKG